MDTEPKPNIPASGIEKSELENAKQRLAKLGYTLEHIENVEGEEVFVYRKPKNLDYPPLVEVGIEDSELQGFLDSVIDNYNNQVILLDSFGNADEARDRLYKKSLFLSEMHDRSKLRKNASITKRWSLIRILKHEVKDPDIKSKLIQKVDELDIFMKRRDYNTLSLSAKIDFADHMDVWFAEALDILFSTVDKQTKKE